MGFVKDLVAGSAVGSAFGIESSGEKAARRAAGVQQEQALASAEDVGTAGTQAGALLDPFAQLGQAGIQQAGFLTDPQAQFDFLQSNPLFQSALQQANIGTQQSAAAQGRLSAGDTLQQLSQNVLLAAQPLIGQQRQAIGGLIDLGRGTALEQGRIGRGTAADVANLQTGAAAAQAGGIVGAQNAAAANQQNLFDIAGLIGGRA